MHSCFKIFSTLITALSLSTSVLCAPAQLTEVFSEMNRIGSASFKFIFWSVYEAELYSEQSSFSFTPLPRFILTLNYQRAFKDTQIVNETEKQMLEINSIQSEKFEPWLSKLDEILIDVVKSDSLSLYVDENKHSSFYLNGDFLGTIEDEDFSQSFSAIWLARDDHYADFTRELTGVL
jgi:hypothetical protein